MRAAKRSEPMRTFLALILALVSIPTAAQSEDGPRPGKILSPYFLVDGATPGIESFPLKSTDVVANISGVIADVTVTQIYENRGATPVHAKYVFPGSTRAAVHGMRIRVRDKAVVAKIQEREKAAQEFAEAKAAGKNAALLEQQRPNVFTMAVAIIMPGVRVEVQMTYSEMLVPEQEIYQFVYPTVVGPRYSNTPEAAAPEDSKWVKSPYLQEGQSSPAAFSIFVLDVSGSMHGFPLDTAKQVLENLVRKLKPTDTFNVVLFSGGSRVLSPVSVAANPQNIARALAVIGGETGGGGTELEAALRTAIQIPRSSFVSRTVVVVTDGYIAEEKGAFTLINENLNNTNFFAFGIGGSVNRYLIEGIARAGQGEPFVVTGPKEAGEAGERFRDYIESPVLTNVRVSYRGFDAYDVEPGAQPDLFADRPVVLFGKWRGPKQGEIEVTGRTATGTFSKVFDIKESVNRPEHTALPQLWARSRLARLSDFNFSRDDAEAIREVTSLGLTYSLLTRHTSFIAVLEEVPNSSGQGADVDQPLPLPDGVSDLAVGYVSGEEPVFWIMLFGSADLLLIAARRRVRTC